MDAAGASILKSMGYDNNSGFRAARTLSMLRDGRMNSRRYSPNTHSIDRILSMPLPPMPQPPHSIGRILDDVNYPRGSGYPPFNPNNPPAYLYRDINPGVVPRGPRVVGGSGLVRKESITTTTKPLNVPLGPARLSSRKNSGGLSRITSGIAKPKPRRVQQLRESTLKKASSAGKCGGGRRRATRRSGARRTRRGSRSRR